MTTTPSAANLTWSFNENSIGTWKNSYQACRKDAARIAPLNIDTNKVTTCHALCRLATNYNPTTCSISMVNGIPTITFKPNCIIKFKNEFLYLRKMTIHNTSMHTINTSYYDLEIMLYHNRNPTSDKDGGVILSVLMKKGDDYGSANDFLNQFINRMPAVETPNEQDIPVSDDWNPSQIFPSSKSFFYYDGALPFPPCSQNWTIIIFEEIVPVAESIIDAVKYALGGYKNIRPVQKKPANIVIFYNSNNEFDSNTDVSQEAVEKTIEDSQTSELAKLQGLQKQSWLKKNIYVIKGIILGVILLLMVFVSIKIAQYIVQNDILNDFILKQIQKKKKKESADAQAEMQSQQEAEYGGPLPNNNAASAEGPINNSQQA
jgi:carbonic anhydrase